MAIVRLCKYSENVPAMLEDPTSTEGTMFFQRDAYSRTDFRHFFNSLVEFNTAGTAISDFGSSTPVASTTILGGVLMLAGETTYIRHSSDGTINSIANNLDQSPWISMDPANRHYPVRYVNNGTNGEVIAGYNYHTWNGVDSGNSNQGDWRWVFARWHNPSLNRSNIKDLVPLQNTNAGQETQIYPVYWNSQSGNLISAGYSPSNLTGGYFISQPHQGSRISGVATTGNISYSISTRTNGHTTQFIGVGQNSHALIFWNANANDHTQTIYRYNDTTNTSTTLHTFNSIPAAGGTSAGGNRGTNFGNTQNKMASMTFTTAAEPTIKKFYVPYLDVNGFYHPIYFTWNIATDQCTRTTDITVNWGAGNNQSTYWSPDTVGGDVVSKGYGHQRAWYNETFVVNNTRYLTFMQLHGAGVIWDLQPKMRTFVTFSINESTPTTLNFHSALVLPETPKNIAWLNDAHTSVAVITKSAMLIYSFDATNGWTLVSTTTGQFYSVGRDSLGRIWAADRDSKSQARIHLVEGNNVPLTVTLTPQVAADFNYSGTASDAALLVNAYDRNGSRMAVPVYLSVIGNSLRIVDQNSAQVSEITVTTSTTADIVVPIKVISAGQSSFQTYVNL